MKQEIIIFGASKLGRIAKLYLEDQYEIRGFCDNDSKKWGGEFEGCRVIAPAELPDFPGRIFIASSWHKEIGTQLQEMGITNFEVFTINIADVTVKPSLYKPGPDQIKNLNIGCGDRFHPQWVNLDFQETGPGVIAHNLLEGLPFADNTFDVVYNSHLFEHFTREQVRRLVKECLRVLRPGGVLRVVVPDLENLCRLYLEALEHADRDEPLWQDNYELIMLLMYDQCVRTQSGGDLLGYLMRDPVPNEEYVSSHVGSYYPLLVEGIRAQQHALGQTAQPAAAKEPTLQEMMEFRQRGEIHLWMYDRFSMRKLFEQAGFHNVKSWAAHTSYIKDWETFHLDTEMDGRIYKADSLYLEGIK